MGSWKGDTLVDRVSPCQAQVTLQEMRTVFRDSSGTVSGGDDLSPFATPIRMVTELT